MERMSKSVFVAKEKRMIEINNDFIAALNIVKNVSEKFNDKRLNIRFTKFINQEFEKAGLSTSIYFDTDYRWNRTNRLYLYHKNRYIENVGAYIDTNELHIYAHGDIPKYISDDQVFSYESMCKACDHYIELCKNKIDESNRCIDEINDIIAAYNAKEKELNDFINSLPRKFNRSVDFHCPVYEG